MATVIRVNPAASPLRNVSFTGLASVAVGDRVPVRIELVNDARSGAAGYTPALFLGVRGTPLASVASWSASTVSGVAGWDGILRCDTSELADFVGLNASMTVMCQIVITKNDTSELVTEAQNQVTVFSTVAPEGVYIPTPDTPTYSDLLALESTAVSAAAEASIDASLAASSALAADSSADLADGYANAALSSAVAADGSADAALSSAVVADLEASIAVSAASAAVAVVPSINAQLALRVIKDAAGNTERMNTVNFTLDPVGVTHSEGVAHWSPDDHCLELGTDQAGVYLQVGQESLVRVRNVTGSTLLNGKVVYINGSTGQRPTVALADNTVSASATKTIGVMTADLANNSDGYATTQGLVRDLNTSAFTDGATVYLGTAGNLTVTQPTAPNEIIRVGHVVKAHVTQGVLLVGVQHHQDAAEVPLASIVGIGATDVQGAVSELASDITAETSARISGDASVSTALSTAISQRISADASLAAAQSVETSRAVSVEATKAPIASPTFTGPVTVASEILTSSGFLKFGNGSGQVFTWHNGSAATAKNHYILSANVPRWAWIYSADGAGGNAGADLTGLCYDDAGASLGSWLSVTRATRAVLFPGALAVTGLATLNGGLSTTALTASVGSTLGTDTSAGYLRLNGPSGVTKIIGFREANIERWALRMAASGAFGLDRKDAAGAYQDSPFAISAVDGVTTLSALTVTGSITNYAADVSVSALLALTPAQSAAKRKATVTGAYRMDGTIGRVEAWWDGDATAGNWVMRSGVPVTADPLTFLRGLATTVTHIPVMRNRKLLSLAFDVQNQPTSGAWATVSGTGALARHSGASGNPSYTVYDTGSTQTGYAAAAATAGTRALLGLLYCRATANPTTLSTESESFYAFTGFGAANSPLPESGGRACFVYDPQNTLALGINNGNWWALTSSTSGVVTLTDTAVAASTNTSINAPLEVYLHVGVKAEFYSGGVLVATHTTGLPDAGGPLHRIEGVKKAVGTSARYLVASSQHVAQLV